MALCWCGLHRVSAGHFFPGLMVPRDRFRHHIEHGFGSGLFSPTDVLFFLVQFNVFIPPATARSATWFALYEVAIATANCWTDGLTFISVVIHDSTVKTCTYEANKLHASKVLAYIFYVAGFKQKKKKINQSCQTLNMIEL